MVSFAVQKLLALLGHICLFLFLFTLLSDMDLKRYCCHFWQDCILPMFSSKSYMVSDLSFKPIIHFEFIFVCGVRKCSKFIFLYVAVQFSQQHLWSLSFIHCKSCLLCCRLIDHRSTGLFLDFPSCSLGLYFYHCASIKLFSLL